MSLVIGTILAVVFLDWPWRAVVIAALALVEVGELMVWLRLRRIRSITGPEGIIGAYGRAVNDCNPTGQVRVKGQLWTAHCADGVTAGSHVVVTGVRGLKLLVEPRSSGPPGVVFRRRAASSSGRAPDF